VIEHTGNEKQPQVEKLKVLSLANIRRISKGFPLGCLIRFTKLASSVLCLDVSQWQERVLK
jgi:hypothetical protein